MPIASPDGGLQPCPHCGAFVDVRDQEPLAKIHCPLCGAAMRANRQFNHFTVMDSLGSGGMGTVYKALDRNLNRMVALKLLRQELSADESYILKLEEEARITASINHPYVVKVFSFDQDDGQYYIAMELVDKGSLDDLMQLQTRIAELQVLQVGLQVAGGLQAAHDRGLIHRDVKPGNILFADAHTAKITDFGLALLAEHEAEARGEIWGTPYYIAPEKLNHEPEDFRSDIYSLGGTLFHAVAGRPPFEAENASLVALKHLKSRVVSLQAFAPDVSNETAYVINRMLHKDPGQRYDSYAELIENLRYAIDTVTARTGRARLPRPGGPVETRRASRRWKLALGAAGALAALAGIAALAVHLVRVPPPKKVPEKTPNALSPAAATAERPAAVAALFADARHQLAGQQYAAAQETLTALAARPDITQPTLNWVRLHQGMAALLNHQMNDARDVFARLKQEGRFSDAPADRKLAGLFAESGRYLGDDQPVPASAASYWNKDSFENIALLLFGLKDWELGRFEDADKLLEGFLSGQPGADYRWMSDYAPIARQLVHDYDLYAPLAAQLAAKPADAPARDALQAKFSAARNQLQTTGKIIEAFFLAESDLREAAAPSSLTPPPTPTPPPSPANLPAAVPAPTASFARDDETIRWQSARESYEQMVGLYHYDEGAAVLAQATLTDPDYLRAREVTLARAKRLIAFKQRLIDDVNAHGGYPQPVTTRRNVAFQRGLKSASLDALVGATPNGPVPVPWTDVAPKALFTIAAYFADAALDPKEAADRRWLAATFAVENKLLREARSLAAQVARDQPERQAEVESLFAPVGAASAPAPDPAPAPSSDGAPSQ